MPTRPCFRTFGENSPSLFRFAIEKYFKFGRHVRFELRRKMRKTAGCSRTSDLSGFHKSPKLKDGQHLRRSSEVNLDTAMNDFNSD